MKSSPIQNLIVKNNKTISTENVAGGEKKRGGGLLEISRLRIGCYTQDFMMVL